MRPLANMKELKDLGLYAKNGHNKQANCSPTLKLKRNVIYKKYAHILEEIYGHGEDKTEKNGQRRSWSKRNF